MLIDEEEEERRDLEIIFELLVEEGGEERTRDKRERWEGGSCIEPTVL